jgi:hypothetical protein
LTLTSDEHSRVEEQQQQQQQQQQDTISFAFGDAALFVTSTPIDADNALAAAPRSERAMENALFRDIEDLVREFLRQPNRQYPYYRIIRWTEGQDPPMEYVLTVVINRPVIVLP